MAGPLLRVLIRLKHNKYHRTQIAARYRILDLFQQIADELHLSVEQLVYLTVYRSGSNGYYPLYPVNSNQYDQLEKFALSNNDELYIDLTMNDDDEEDVCSLISTTDSSTSKNLGQLIRYSVPADNSCLFSSIDFVLHNGKLEQTSNEFLRNLIAKKVQADQSKYSDAVLGRTNDDYCQWIRRNDSWGGGIELSILTEEYQIEICVINTESGGRIDYFGEDKQFPHRVFLFYDKLHYDPVCFVSYDILEQKESVETKFHRNNEHILSLAKSLVNIE